MLADVVDFVRADFARSCCPASVWLGVEYLNDHDSPMRVVFIPTKDSFQQGLGVRGNPANLGPRGAINPQPFLLRHVGFTVHVWAAGPVLEDASLQVPQDYRILQALVNQVLLSLQRCLQGSWRQLGGETDQRTAHARNGVAYVLQCTAEMPVVVTQFSGAIDPCTLTWLNASASARVTVEMADPSGETVTASTTITAP